MRAIIVLSFVALVFATACGDDNIIGPENRFSAEDAFAYSVLAAGRDTLGVEGINGTIQVTGVSGATEASISGVRRVEAKSQSAADSGLGVLEVEIDSSAAGVVARTTQPSDDRNYIVNYVISIPDAWAVRIVNANGDVTVLTLKNDLLVNCANGTVSADVSGGDAVVMVANGAITGVVTMAPGGVVDLGLANGTIDLRVPQDTSAELSATVGTGTITTANLTMTDVTQTPKSITGTLGAGDGTILLNAGNGAITVTGF